MIKNLEGTRETVHFDSSAPILLYNNIDYEEYPTHWHTPIEVILPLEGGYNIQCNNIPIALRDNDVAIITPGVLHKLYASKGRRIIFQIDLRQMQFLEEVDALLSLVQPAVIITPEDYPDIHDEIVRLMKEIYDEYYSTSPLKNTAICSNFLRILYLIARRYTATSNRFTGIRPNKLQEYNETFLSVCDYINKHCTENITLDEIAEIAGFSKYHFSRLFKEFANDSFHRYLNKRRIAYAERLLQDPSVNITEVALSSGFNSISSFMRMFKSVKGCTPSKFRELHW